MAERKYRAPAPETESTVSNADWSGQDISRQNHSRVLFVDLDMTETRDTGAVFTECIFRRARFNASTHDSAAFVNCTFTACKFYDATFTECKFVGSMFDGCSFEIMKAVGGNRSSVCPERTSEQRLSVIPGCAKPI
jgi:uncharacterized protein YjbI with pentapeptide repeats